MATLPTASSIVDYLKNKKFPTTSGESLPYYNTRTQIYNSSGLGGTLGDYRGTADQNTQLLKYLQGAESSAGVSLTPENLNSIISASRAGGVAPVGAATALPRAQSVDQYLTPGSPAAVNAAAPAQNAVSTAQAAETAPSVGTNTKAPQDIIDAIYNPLAGRNIADEALASITSSAAYPLQQAEQQAQKDKIKLDAQKQTQDLISSLASKGLYFSGKKDTGLKEVEAQKLSELLGIDRKYALILAQGVESAMQTIVKNAQQGSQTALDTLKAAGFTVLPDGTVAPTLEAQKFQQGQYEFERTSARLDDSAAAKAELDQAKFELSVAKTQAQLEQAAQKIELAQAKYELAVAKSGTGTGSSGIGGGAPGTTVKDAAKKGFTQTLNNAGGINFLKNGQPITFAEWITGSGVNVDDALKNSRDPSDIAFLADYNAGLKGVDAGELTADDFVSFLSGKYPRYMGAVTQTQGGTAAPVPVNYDSMHSLALKGDLDFSQLDTAYQQKVITGDQYKTLNEIQLTNSGLFGVVSGLAKAPQAIDSFFKRLFGG